MLSAQSCLKLSANLLFLSTIGFSTPAQAQSVDVPFSGSVPPTCTFGTITNGILVKDPTRAAIAGSVGVTALTVGTAGKANITCTSSTTLTVASPTAVSVPGSFSPAILQSVVQRGTNINPSDFTSTSVGGSFVPTPTTPLALPAGASLLNVAMVAGTTTPGSIPSGSYSYTVKLTVASN
jgi:hypothetical protein